MKKTRKRDRQKLDHATLARVTGGGGWGNDLLNADDVLGVRSSDRRG